jgi:hypothetical protein
LYVILEAAGHPVARACARLIPTVANAKLAEVLAIKRGTPLLHVDQIDYDERGRASGDAVTRVARRGRVRVDRQPPSGYRSGRCLTPGPATPAKVPGASPTAGRIAVRWGLWRHGKYLSDV